MSTEEKDSEQRIKDAKTNIVNTVEQCINSLHKAYVSASGVTGLIHTNQIQALNQNFLQNFKKGTGIEVKESKADSAHDDLGG